MTTHSRKVVPHLAATAAEHGTNSFAGLQDQCYLLDGAALRFRDANPEALRALGYSLPELHTLTLDGLLVGIDREALAAAFAPLSSGAKSQVVLQAELRGKDGALRPVELRVQRAAEAEPAALLALAIDTSERRRALAEQCALLEHANLSERRYREFIECAPDAMLIANSGGEIIVVNRQMEAMFGYAREELLGQPVEILLPEALRAAHAGHRDAFTTKPSSRPMGAMLDLRARRQDGSDFPVEVALAPIHSPQGLLVFVSIRDVTEQRRTRDALRNETEALRRSNEDLKLFAYVASHDLQEPLRMVASYLQLIERRYSASLDETGREFMNYATDGAKRMQDLINDLLLYSRVSQTRLSFDNADLERLLTFALHNFELAIRDSHAEITHDALPTVRGDPPQLIQLFQNLIGNAIKFRRVGVAPRVHVGAKRAAAEWVFSVADNGIGIERQYGERIFVIFQRLHAKGEHPGTGIGLAICKRIAERHGGRIWVESTPGQGSTFFFTLPTEEVQTS